MRFAVELDRVRKEYAGGPPALADVSLRISAGEFVSVTGPSGCGKTTLLNVIAGIDQATTGRVVTLGQDLATLKEDARSDLRLSGIGFVFQAFNLIPTFTAVENVTWPLEFLGVGRRDARRRAVDALAAVSLDPTTFGRRPGEISGGEQQRVAIARALATGPTLFLADEPTGNLDSTTGSAVLELLRSLNRDRGLTVVLVTHSEVAAACGNRVVALRDGRVVSEDA